ncbi:N-acetyltransferase [Desertihabitans brevis]|uniref:N-acetyltransferase n=1 Tax=Desertihabitans brevis TaxID=2268447 RepID=UPI0018F75F78|nr:N-acetyltransferase [Desertihabitans brevis]
MPSLAVVSLAERPELTDAFWSVPGDWPEFMLQDPVSATRYGDAVDRHPDLHLVLLEDDEPVGRLHAVPVRWPGPDALPVRGWDWALEQGVDDPPAELTAVSLIEARLAPQHRSRGLSRVLLAAARERCARAGVVDLLAPVRPAAKAAEPTTPFAEYVHRQRPDGLPADPWIRVHARAGGVLAGVAPLSMTIPGTLAQWRAWTGLALDTDGPQVVPGALVPVHVDTAQDHAVYVEPNVWVHHRLG